MRRDALRDQGGFTLIEVLIVIVMIGVLLAIAAPSFVTFTASQRVKTASFDLYAALTLELGEAAARTPRRGADPYWRCRAARARSSAPGLPAGGTCAGRVLPPSLARCGPPCYEDHRG